MALGLWRVKNEKITWKFQKHFFFLKFWKSNDPVYNRYTSQFQWLAPTRGYNRYHNSIVLIKIYISYIFFKNINIGIKIFRYILKFQWFFSIFRFLPADRVISCRIALNIFRMQRILILSLIYFTSVSLFTAGVDPKIGSTPTHSQLARFLWSSTFFPFTVSPTMFPRRRTVTSPTAEI